jgi:hypothetical protein
MLLRLKPDHECDSIASLSGVFLSLTVAIMICTTPLKDNYGGGPSFTPSFPVHLMGKTSSIRDMVSVPAGLAPGKYVLGFRYDCEASSQVWSNCADIDVVA